MNLYRRVIGYYRPYLGTICFSLILLVIGVNFNLLKYWPVKWVIDSVIKVGPDGKIHWQMLTMSPSQAALFAEIENLAAVDRDGIVPGHLLDGLAAIAERAPLDARAVVPVHADCHWGNWLARDGRITALLDFEWARFGEPVDDWFFLARFSGPHMEAVLDAIARATASSIELLRAECEVREAAYLASDLRIALERDET